MKVPFLDLKAHHDPIRAEVMDAISAVVDKNAFAGGPFVADFESDFARYCGTRHALGVGNGTDALWVALLALGIGRGDEVITVPMTFMATAEAITYSGATPVFVDIDATGYTMDPARIEAAITPRTKAIIPVHLYGQCADMDPILEIARRHKLYVIEDAAQAQGAQYKSRSSKFEVRSSGGAGSRKSGVGGDGSSELEVRSSETPASDSRLPTPQHSSNSELQTPNSELPSSGAPRPAGSMGDVGCFSFYPGKNLGAWGEAGAVVTNNTELHQRMAMFREHGQSKKYYHDVVGWNLRMDGIQAAVLKVKLKYLDRANDGRRRAAAQYGELLRDLEDARLPQEMPYARHIWHVYPVRFPDRDRLMEKLAARGVATGIHYPVPVHLTQAYANLELRRGAFPVAEACADEFVSLPVYPELTEQQVAYVADAVREELGVPSR